MPKGKEPQVEKKGKKVNDYVHLVLHSFYLSNRPPHTQRESTVNIYIDASFYFYVCVLSDFFCVFFQQDTGNEEKTPRKSE